MDWSHYYAQGFRSVSWEPSRTGPDKANDLSTL
ncbi:hypothetical protein HDF08_002459 [Edaphobacter lichenicola]|uniref:Uncharacterized protein n=1 Tax=Tunturiibacter lichenicola TaxID=2051959 RepID=A0A852VLV0_9BACT|nr:hypothetical protein [Edaphobacter lichenicola]